MGTFLNNKVTSKKRKNAKEVALSRQQKGHFFRVGTDTGRQRSPCSTSAGDVNTGRFRFFTSPSRSTDDHKTAASVVFEVTNTFYQGGELENAESANIEPVNDEDGHKTPLCHSSPELSGPCFAPRALGFAYPTSIIGPIRDIQPLRLRAGLLCFLRGETVVCIPIT